MPQHHFNPFICVLPKHRYHEVDRKPLDAAARCLIRLQVWYAASLC